MAEQPHLPDDPTDELNLARALEEFCRRADDGEDPDPRDYVPQHPGLGDCLEGVAAMAALRTALQSLPPEGTGTAAAMGDYEIQREIGRGGMGVVYETRHRRLGRRAALKVIK